MIPTIIIIILLLLFFIFHETIDPFISSITQENDLDFYVNDSDLFMKQRLKKSKPILFLIVFWSIFDYSITYLVVIFGLFIFLIKKDYLSLKQKAKKQSNLLRFQFPIWLRQIQILLQTNTVSQSLKLSYEHAPDLIKNDLKTLIQEIDKDALNISPYLNFLKGYRLSEIERAMKLLYRYNTIGKDDAYLQFNRMIQTTTKWLRSERESHHEDSLAIYEWCSMIPLIGVTILFLAIMYDVLINMFTNGI